MTMKKTKRIWGCVDFAEHAGTSYIKARRTLQRLHEQSGGKLFLPRRSKNTPLTFYRATLFKLQRDLFAPIEDIEPRVEELEEQLAETRAHLKRVVATVGDVNRGLARAWDHMRGRGVRQ
jgi:hypothetical protein